MVVNVGGVSSAVTTHNTAAASPGSAPRGEVYRQYGVSLVSPEMTTPDSVLSAETWGHACVCDAPPHHSGDVNSPAPTPAGSHVCATVLGGAVAAVAGSVITSTAQHAWSPPSPCARSTII